MAVRRPCFTQYHSHVKASDVDTATLNIFGNTAIFVLVRLYKFWEFVHPFCSLYQGDAVTNKEKRTRITLAKINLSFI
jgi:hypothetical protein